MPPPMGKEPPMLPPGSGDHKPPLEGTKPLGDHLVPPPIHDQVKRAPVGDDKNASPGHDKHAPPGHDKNAPPGHDKHPPPGHDKHAPPGHDQVGHDLKKPPLKPQPAIQSHKAPSKIDKAPPGTDGVVEIHAHHHPPDHSHDHGLHIVHDGHGHETITMDGKVVSADQAIIHHGGHTHTVAEAKRDAGYIFSVMFTVMVLAQFGLFYWQKFHQKSFQIASLIGLWIIPCVWSFMGGFVRMIVVWLLFSAVTVRIIYQATRVPINKKTPRAVYQWFFAVYKVCYGIAVLGNICVILDFFGVSLVFSDTPQLAPIGFVLIFYGLYFGVLGRDCAVMCAARMASTMGYSSTKDGNLPSRQLQQNICAVCDCTLFKNLRLDQDDSQNEKIFTLNCGHQFHEPCIRGWTIVGKRDICPNCAEKVSLREIFTNPWETQSIAWGMILDGLRYLVVYNPMICLLMQLVLYAVY